MVTLRGFTDLRMEFVSMTEKSDLGSGLERLIQPIGDNAATEDRPDLGVAYPCGRFDYRSWSELHRGYVVVKYGLSPDAYR